jgi:signal transduction histidine kinase
VSDTGKGMTTKMKLHIFEPGFTTKARGWGIGLNLVKRIVEDYHKGRIYVKSTTPGKGTTFAIELNY